MMVFIDMKRIIITETQAKELTNRLVKEESDIQFSDKKKLNLINLSSKSNSYNAKKHL